MQELPLEPSATIGGGQVIVPTGLALLAADARMVRERGGGASDSFDLWPNRRVEAPGTVSR
jgi:hypothetical protein